MNKLIISTLFVLSTISLISADYQYGFCRFGTVGTIGQNISGYVTLTGQDGNLILNYNFDSIDLANGAYAAAIMTYGYNPSNNSDLGGVFQINNQGTMGCQKISPDPRAGDLNNIYVTNNKATGQFNVSSVSIGNSVNSIIGRSIVIFQERYSCDLALLKSSVDSTIVSSTLTTVAAQCIIGIGNSANVPSTPGVNTTTGNLNTAGAYSGLSTTQYDAMVLLSNTTKSPTNAISGSVLFRSSTNSNTITVNGIVSGVSKDVHGFHIHAFGDVSTLDGSSIGGHWLTASQNHAFPENTTRHYGDLGNLCIFDNDFKNAYYYLSTNYFSFSGLVGRGFAVHLARDDGNSYVGGDRIAQGVVALIPKATTSLNKVPSNWKFEVICSNGTYTGDSTIEPTPTPTPTPTETNQPGASSYLSPLTMSSSIQHTNFKNGKGNLISVNEESIDRAKLIILSVEKSTPTKSKRGRNDRDDNGDKYNTEPILPTDNKVNKFDNKESTGFKTASNLPIRVSKETLNSEKSKIDIELQKEIDLNKYETDIALLEQPFKVDTN
ncbi:hypothetical protein RB653_001705 [Dictyostelium firmibasis]|uniref:Superoxide dismutase copper/zinc binding domain-containing protein n=1 Tax=Dictyostelium firmibasis TaxID=79012 RepID=A0AAN7U7Q8_9MYCE